MVKINLLPHRQQKRKKIQQVFFAKLCAVALAGAASVVAVSLFIDLAIDHQQSLNDIIAKENQQLDVQVKEVATLKHEIDALKARQRAVENLQNDRNQSIYLMEDLAREVPEGIYLYEVSQEEKTVTLNGFAQSNEHVSEFMRNIETHAKWTENPQLQEIRSSYRQRTNNANHVFDFTMTIALKTFVVLEPDSGTDSDDNDSEDDDMDDSESDDSSPVDDLPPANDKTTPPPAKRNAGQPTAADAPVGAPTAAQTTPANTATPSSATTGVAKPTPVAPAATPAPEQAPAPAQASPDNTNAPRKEDVPTTPETTSTDERTTQTDMPGSGTEPNPDTAPQQ